MLHSDLRIPVSHAARYPTPNSRSRHSCACGVQSETNIPVWHSRRMWRYEAGVLLHALVGCGSRCAHMRVRIHARAYVCRLLREAHADMRNADIRLSEVRSLPVAAAASWCLYWRRRLRSHR